MAIGIGLGALALPTVLNIGDVLFGGAALSLILGGLGLKPTPIVTPKAAAPGAVELTPAQMVEVAKAELAAATALTADQKAVLTSFVELYAKHYGKTLGA